jgi:hypothetical protein
MPLVFVLYLSSLPSFTIPVKKNIITVYLLLAHPVWPWIVWELVFPGIGSHVNYWRRPRKTKPRHWMCPFTVATLYDAALKRQNMHSLILLTVLRQVQILLPSEFSTESDVVLPLQIFCKLPFPYSHPALSRNSAIKPATASYAVIWMTCH